MSNWFEEAPVLQEKGATKIGEVTPESSVTENEAPEATQQVTPTAEETAGVTQPEGTAQGVKPTEQVATPEPVAQTTPAAEQVEERPEPVKFDLSKVIEEHEDSVAKYLEMRRTDFQSMPADKVLERKLREDNPDWSDSDIRSELADKYGVGLQKIEINEDEMSSEEIKEAKENNRLVERGERLLKSDAKSAREYFEKIKQETKLPELELPGQKEISEEEQIAQYQEQLAQQRNAWIEQVNSASKSVSNIQRTIEVEDGENGKVAFNIDYKLSDKQKQEVSEYLYDYMAHPKDVEKYVKEDGTPDLVRFMVDKAILNENILDSMLRSVAKEAMAVARKSVIKKTLLNHNDGVRSRNVVLTEGNSLEEAQNRAWARK